MRNKFKIYRVLAYTFSVLAVAEVVVYISLALGNILVDENHYLEIMFAFLTPAIIIVAFAFILVYINYLMMFKTLLAENEHYLGLKNSYFYNHEMFTKSLKHLIKLQPGENYYMMVFTPCSDDLANSTTRNTIIVKYNRLISQMLDDYFKRPILLASRRNSFCYNRGMFNIFLVGDENKVNEVLKDLEAKLYDVAKANEIRIFVQPFFGVAKFEKAKDVNMAIENATLARYQAERNFELSSFYDPKLRNENLLSEAKEIVDGLAAKEFVVYYQPKFNLEKKCFVGSEALVRWNSSKYGFLNPSQFIDKAEKGGLIHEIDMYVFNRVCEDLNESKRRGRRVLPVSINFSLYEFFSPNFVEDIVKIIDSKGIDHRLIEIEVTETTTQSNPFLSISIMKQIKKQGLRILMDDFGTGYSNFTNLRKMPIDAIKIDKSFVDTIVNDDKSREIMKFLIALGKNSNLEVIAEGVDNKEQVEILTKDRLDTIQGYFYSRPISNKDYHEFLRNNPFEKRDKSGGGVKIYDTSNRK